MGEGGEARKGCGYGVMGWGGGSGEVRNGGKNGGG